MLCFFLTDNSFYIYKVFFQIHHWNTSLFAIQSAIPLRAYHYNKQTKHQPDRMICHFRYTRQSNRPIFIPSANDRCDSLCGGAPLCLVSNTCTKRHRPPTNKNLCGSTSKVSVPKTRVILALPTSPRELKSPRAQRITLYSIRKPFVSPHHLLAPAPYLRY